MTDLTTRDRALTMATTLALMAEIYADALAKVAAARDNLGNATADLDKAIKAARSKGASLRAIAEAASLSHEKVRYITQ
jgi:hypothetical protein